MKVLYVVSGQNFFSSDPGRKRIAMVRCWEELGHEVMLICGGDTLPRRRKQYVKRIDADLAHPPWYRRLRILAPMVNSVSEFLNIQHDLRLAKVVARAIREFKPDIYWQRSSSFDGITFAKAQQSGVVTILEWKDHLLSLYGLSLFKPYAAWMERRKEASADYIVVESEVLKRALGKKWQRDDSSVYVAYNAVEPRDFTTKEKVNDRTGIRKKLGIAAHDFVAAYAGTFNPWYHHVEIMVEALKFTKPVGNRKIQLLLIGDGAGRPLVEKVVKTLGVEDRVHFTGLVPYAEVPDLLAASDAAVLPDGTDIITPIKVLEYMAMGLPTLMPDYEVNREVASDGDTGFLFKPKCPQDLANKLMHLLEDPEKGQAVGSRARARVLDRFVWKSTWGKVLEDIGEKAL